MPKSFIKKKLIKKLNKNCIYKNNVVILPN